MITTDLTPKTNRSATATCVQQEIQTIRDYSPTNSSQSLAASAAASSQSVRRLAADNPEAFYNRIPVLYDGSAHYREVNLAGRGSIANQAVRNVSELVAELARQLDVEKQEAVNNQNKDSLKAIHRGNAAVLERALNIEGNVLVQEFVEENSPNDSKCLDFFVARLGRSSAFAQVSSQGTGPMLGLASYFIKEDRAFLETQLQQKEEQLQSVIRLSELLCAGDSLERLTRLGEIAWLKSRIECRMVNYGVGSAIYQIGSFCGRSNGDEEAQQRAKRYQAEATSLAHKVDEAYVPSPAT